MMTVEEIANAESAMVAKVQSLEQRWKIRGGDPTDWVLRPEAEALLKDISNLAGEVVPRFVEEPITSMGDPELAWAAYELANARLALTYLLLFGCNHITAREEGLVLEALV